MAGVTILWTIGKVIVGVAILVAAKRLSKAERTKFGSIGWYTTTVKLDPEIAREIQAEKLGEKVVKLNTAPAHNIPSHDSVI